MYKIIFQQHLHIVLRFCGESGIRTRGTLLRYTHFPGVRLQPLGHLSKTGFNSLKNGCQKYIFFLIHLYVLAFRFLFVLILNSKLVLFIAIMVHSVAIATV